MNNKVKLVAITKPIIDDVNTAEEFIAYAARVSNPNNQKNSQTAAKLLSYCINNKHWSPFEMVDMVVEINTTRDIGRQILRHRSMSFQEFSTRYSNPTENLGFSIREARLQDNKNRQNSFETDDEDLKLWFQEAQEEVIENISELYSLAISYGIAKEQARALLPEGLINSRMYMKGSLRSFIHFIQVRNHPAAQKEIRDIAKEITDIVIEQFPSLANYIYNMITENFEQPSTH